MEQDELDIRVTFLKLEVSREETEACDGALVWHTNKLPEACSRRFGARRQELVARRPHRWDSFATANGVSMVERVPFERSRKQGLFQHWIGWQSMSRDPRRQRMEAVNAVENVVEYKDIARAAASWNAEAARSLPICWSWMCHWTQAWWRIKGSPTHRCSADLPERPFPDYCSGRTVHAVLCLSHSSIRRCTRRARSRAAWRRFSLADVHDLWSGTHYGKARGFGSVDLAGRCS